MACAAIAYGFGRQHGREEGEILGEIRENKVSVKRTLRAKLDGFASGRVAGFVEAMRLMGTLSPGEPATKQTPK